MGSLEQNQQENLATLDAYVLSMGGEWLLQKALGLNGHGGGRQVTSGTEPYVILVDYLSDLTGETMRSGGIEQATYLKESPATTYRRASLLLTGEIPSREKLVSMSHVSDEYLRNEILNLMHGEGFREFIKRAANDQLLVRSLKSSRVLINTLNDYYPKFNETFNKTSPPDYGYAAAVMDELAEAPLELIAYIIEQDRPYTEILTSNQTMVSSKTAEIYRTGLAPREGEYVPAINKGQNVSGNSSAKPRHNWSASQQIVMSHAGILTEPAFLQQYPTTATNRNRARSRWTLMHFLGIDIEASSMRSISATALKDFENPTLNNEACRLCHNTLDPIAGAFQNFNNHGIYRAGPYGMDSLDSVYKRSSLYTRGDLWYADMLKPGFENEPINDQSGSLRELALYLVADPRFAQATVKFWWPAIFGEPFFNVAPGENQNEAKSHTLTKLSQSFENSQFNLRSLLADILMSDWFRATQLSSDTVVSAKVPTYTGGKRLLTPEELVNKTASLTSVKDEKLAGDMATLYGGINSLSIDKRQRDLSHIMLRAAERHALGVACEVVASEFNKPLERRRLFRSVEREDISGNGFNQSTVLTATNATRIAYHLPVEHRPGQIIHFVAKQLKWAHEEPLANNITIEKIEIFDPNGHLVVSGKTSDLYHEHEWISGNPVNGRANPYRIRKGYRLQIDIPVTTSGTYQVFLTVAANTAGASLDVNVEHEINLADALDSNTQKIRKQIGELVERMHGENLPHDSEKILQYTKLFIDLRANSVGRNASLSLVETGIRCGYQNSDVDPSVWGADSNHALKAWRGLMVALMTDFEYLYE